MFEGAFQSFRGVLGNLPVRSIFLALSVCLSVSLALCFFQPHFTISDGGKCGMLSTISLYKSFKFQHYKFYLHIYSMFIWQYYQPSCNKGSHKFSSLGRKKMDRDSIETLQSSDASSIWSLHESTTIWILRQFLHRVPWESCTKVNIVLVPLFGCHIYSCSK
jgi:hypothetical protein